MSDYDHHEMFPLGENGSGADTPWRKLTGDHVSTATFEGETVLKVDTKALTLLATEAFKDISHLLRPEHLQQLANILEDEEASDNDRFVAIDLLKNANIAAGGVLPMCQDTGTAIIMGKKGGNVWTGGGDEAALSEGVLKTYTETNLRYSQVAPLDLFLETNTDNNLPAQIDIYANEGDAYKFLFIAKELPVPGNQGVAEPGKPDPVFGRETPHAGHRGVPALSPGRGHRRHICGIEPENGEAG